MKEGPLAALDEIGKITGEKEVSAIGYCVGGTLLSVTLAWMAAKGDTRIASATLFATQVDFEKAGDLKVFADEDHILSIEKRMAEHGYLQGSKMAAAFNMLRSQELIWPYLVNNYMRGKQPTPFDLLYWNADATRMPEKNHSFYLRNCYLENNLTRGKMVVGDETLDLAKVTIPIYELATREDHIAPPNSVFTGAGAFGGPVRYVLSGSGHIAGVVNPPARKKYQYWLGGPPVGAYEDWLAAATEHPGSWWPDWLTWLKAQAPEEVPASKRNPGGRRKPIADAPGTYVRVMA
jgi:polyhydroxyalkanoate synthase